MTWATRALLALIAVATVAAVLVVVRSEDLLAAWARGHPPDSLIKPPAFVPVAIVLYVVFVGSVLLMLAFLLKGHGWARWCLGAIVVFVVVATVAALRTRPPGSFVVVSVVGLAVAVVSMALLWHPRSTRFLRE